MVGETTGVIRILRTHYPICMTCCGSGESRHPRAPARHSASAASGPRCLTRMRPSGCRLVHSACSATPAAPAELQCSCVVSGRDLPRACTHKTSLTLYVTCSSHAAQRSLFRPRGLSARLSLAREPRFSARSRRPPCGPPARLYRMRALCLSARAPLPLRWLGEEVGRTRTRS